LTETLCESPETRFIGLMSELFQLREAEELDFGIYRVIRRHNQKVREFLGSNSRSLYLIEFLNRPSNDFSA